MAGLGPGQPTVHWTVKEELAEWPGEKERKRMLRVQLDVGQHSFKAGREITAGEHWMYGAAQLMAAITHHAREKRWL